MARMISCDDDLGEIIILVRISDEELGSLRCIDLIMAMKMVHIRQTSMAGIHFGIVHIYDDVMLRSTILHRQ